MGKKVTWAHASFVLVLIRKAAMFACDNLPALVFIQSESGLILKQVVGENCSLNFFMLAFLNMSNYQLLNVNIHFLTPMKHCDLGSFPVVCLDYFLRLSFSA